MSFVEKSLTQYEFRFVVLALRPKDELADNTPLKYKPNTIFGADHFLPRKIRKELEKTIP